MAALAWRRITTVHPWGIEYVDPRPDRLLIRPSQVPPTMRASGTRLPSTSGLLETSRPNRV